MSTSSSLQRRRRWIKWAAAIVVALLLAGGVMRALSARKLQQQALASSTMAKEQAQLELAPTDVIKLQMVEVVRGLPVSGSLKAVSSAVVKARVAGELQGLSVREGDYVKAGQVLARIDSSEYLSRLRQAREQAESAKAQVEVVQRQYDNNKALVEQGFISRTALDASLANLNAALSTYRAAQAATDVAGKSVEDTVLKSPISGQVAQRLAQPGERVGVDARIVEIVDLSRLELEATLSPTDTADIQIGQRAELEVEGTSQAVNARVARINPSAQSGSRNVLAYLSIDNAPVGTALPLRQGLFAQGTLGTARVRQVALPLSSVRTDKPAPYVQSIESGRVVHRTVTLGERGLSGKESVVAVQGLEEGALVIRASIGYLREGTQVRFTPMEQAPTALQPTSSPAAGRAP